MVTLSPPLCVPELSQMQTSLLCSDPCVEKESTEGLHENSLKCSNGLFLLHLFLDLFRTARKLKIIVERESCGSYCELESWRSREMGIG